MTNHQTNRRVLVVEDDDGFRELLRDELDERGFDVEAADSIAGALPLSEREPPAVIVSDLQLPNGTGLELFERLRDDELIQPAFVLITAFGSISQAVEALKLGVDDFLTKPVDFSELTLRLERLLEVRQLRAELHRQRESRADGDYHQMVGRSRAMQELYARIDRIAESDAAVIISGESGTGKELAARALHAESPRSDGPFVPVNCAGIQESLLESEFFGHTEGAFTGADQPREGLFQEADGGTILLDEFTELPVSLQAKLLRALQENEVRPVGSNRAQPVDVRVMAATNRDLEDDGPGESVREDFYYRLSTFALEVPPLRERSEDIVRLASYFLEQSETAARSGIDGMTERALDCLSSYDFPGNVRELENILERAVVFCDGEVIERSDLPSECRQQQQPQRPGGADPAAADTLLPVKSDDGELVTMDALKRRYIHHVLEETDDNKSRAADILNIGRRTLYRYIDSE